MPWYTMPGQAMPPERVMSSDTSRTAHPKQLVTWLASANLSLSGGRRKTRQVTMRSMYGLLLLSMVHAAKTHVIGVKPTKAVIAD